MLNFPAAALAALGIGLPDELNRVAAVRTAANIAATDDPVGKLKAGLLDGSVTIDKVEEEVRAAARALIERKEARTLFSDLEPTLARLERRALISSGDDLIKRMRPVFNEHVAALTASIEAFGKSPSEAAVLAAGPAAAEGWAARLDAIRQLDNVRKVRTGLGDAGYGNVEPMATWYMEFPSSNSIHNGPNLDTLRRAQSAYGRRFIGLLESGFSLHLNTAAEAEEVVAKCRSATEAAAQRERLRAQAAESGGRQWDAASERIAAGSKGR